MLTVTAGTSGATVSGSGSKSVTISGTLAQINDLLNTNSSSTVSYIDNTYNPSPSATLALLINDNGNTGTGGALTGSDTATINIAALASAARYTTFHNGSQTNQTEIDTSGTNSGTARIILTFSGAVHFSGGNPSLTIADGDETPPGSDSDAATYSASLSDPTHGVLVFTYTPESDAVTHDLAIISVNGTILDAGNNNVSKTPFIGVLTNHVHTDNTIVQEHLGVNEAAAPAGVAGDPINLALTDQSGGQSDPVTVTITGVPSDWSLDQGTNLGGGTWAVQTSDPTALTIRTPANFAGAALLNVTESWTNADGSTGTASLKDNVEAYAAGSPIFAWSGNDTLTGAGANNLFVFAQPIGNDTVYNFNAGTDKIDLIGFKNIASFSDIHANLSDDARGNAVISIGSDESITLHGVNAAALTANNFVFDQTPLTDNAGMMTIGDNAMLPLSGIINNTGTIALESAGNTTILELIQNGVTLQGGGHVILSDSNENVISSAFPGVTLTNVDNTISGAGQLGDAQTILVNEGAIVATGTHALTIDTGSNAVINSGTLEATGSGGLIVNSDISNTGLIWADGGNITIGGAVTGTGSALISGAAILEFGTASSVNVTFAGDNFGTLMLDNPTAYTGQILGFTGTTPQNSDVIDLKGITFDAGTSWTYFDNAGSDTGGTLTISETINDTTTAVDTLAFANGNYTTANFILTADGSGGTLIVDPPAESDRTIIDGGAPAPTLTTGTTDTADHFNDGSHKDITISDGAHTIAGSGSGNDTFVFKATTDSQPGAGHFDTINNFTHGSDHLDFTAIAGATQVQQNAVAAAGLVDANSISWFVDNDNNQTVVYVNTTSTPNHVDMEIHLTGTNINLAGTDFLHHA